MTLTAIQHWRLIVALTVLVGCVAPATPQVGCRLNTECASGRCLEGICVPEAADTTGDADTADSSYADAPHVSDAADAGDAQPGDAKPDTTPDAGDAVVADVVAPCTTHAECAVLAGSWPSCTTPQCADGTCILSPEAEGAACTTKDLCPATGECTAGSCKATAKPCDDANPCTIDTCLLSTGCTHANKPNGLGGCPGDSTCTIGMCQDGICDPTVVAAGACRIDGACWNKDEISPANACARCDPATSSATWQLSLSGPCDDGSACTENDGCSATGTCGGTALLCDDKNVCTTDTCDPQLGCKYVANSAPCDDGNPCSLTELCVDGGCTVQAWNTCNDGNTCTLDSCVVATGCIHSAANGPCVADNDACTEDKCAGGACTAVPVSSVCVIDGQCHPEGAHAEGEPCLVCATLNSPTSWTPLNAVDCDDNNACTAADACYGGACLGFVAGCDDKNPCTLDTCSPQNGCLFVPTQTGCDDGNACTGGDDCASGKCAGLALAATACADDNPCTDDNCEPLVGCIHAPNLAKCNDGDPCSNKDFCTAGKCHAGQFLCNCLDDPDCDDGNACTADGCDTMSFCVNQLLPTAACDDGNACTSLDHCAAGFCVGAISECDDANPCTLDGCTPEDGCIHKPTLPTPCSDNNQCTTSDLCVAGTCQGATKNCDDGKFCTTDDCDSQTGKCGHVTLADGTTCTSDGSSCTIDACVSSVCSHAAIVPGLCQIDGVCMLDGTTLPGESCVGCVAEVSQSEWSVRVGLTCSDGNACTAGDLCGPAKDCVGTPVSCEDGNPCTLDVCNPLANTSGGAGTPCLHAPAAATCTDADPCTQTDTCVLGKCVGQPTVCNDNNVCTLDFCTQPNGCATSPAPGGAACTGDGLPCTDDICTDGGCTHPVVSGACLSGGACWADGQARPDEPCLTCQPDVTPLAWSAATGPSCEDGNPCTVLDVCASGACAGSGAPDCDDANPCTTDTCAPASGCAHTATTGESCEDGDLCTTGDTCDDGSCMGGNSVVCPAAPGGTCQAAACAPTTGCGLVSACNSLEGCFGGVCSTLDAMGLPAPATIPLDPAAAPQPLAPTLRWQPADPDHGIPLPHLRLAVQTRGCSPALGLYSTIATVTLPPDGATPTVQTLSATAPSGSSAWCAVAPQFLPAPGGMAGTLLAWMEGGNALSACDIVAKGGALRLGLIAPSGTSVEPGPLSECPASGVTSARPAIWLQAQPGAGVADLAGAVARATKTGPQVWLGQASAGWGQSGLPLLPGGWPLAADAGVAARPALVTDAAFLHIFTLSEHAISGNEVLSSVDLTSIPADFSTIPGASVLVAGIDNSAAKVVYRGVEVASHPGSETMAVLISGTLENSNGASGFLTIARTSPGATAVTPTVLRFFAPSPGLAALPVVHAFRIAAIPGSPDFLVAFGTIDETNIELWRVHPEADLVWQVIGSKVLATDFVSHEVGDTIVNSGGLSELAISPDGLSVSLAYETVGALRLVSTAVP